MTVYRYRHTRDPRVCLYRGIPSQSPEFNNWWARNCSLATLRRIVAGTFWLKATHAAAQSSTQPTSHTRRATLHVVQRDATIPTRLLVRSAQPPLRDPECGPDVDSRRPSSADPGPCGPPYRDYGEVGGDPKPPPNRETRPQACARRARNGCHCRRAHRKKRRRGLYCDGGTKALGQASTAPATDEAKTAARRIAKGSKLCFALVSPGRTTVRGGVAVCQFLLFAIHCDRNIVFRL